MMYLDAFREATGEYLFVVGLIIKDLPWPWMPKLVPMEWPNVH